MFFENIASFLRRGFTGLLPLYRDGVNHQPTPESLLFLIVISACNFKVLSDIGLLKFTKKFTKASLLDFSKKFTLFSGKSGVPGWCLLALRPAGLGGQFWRKSKWKF